MHEMMLSIYQERERKREREREREREKERERGRWREREGERELERVISAKRHPSFFFSFFISVISAGLQIRV